MRGSNGIGHTSIKPMEPSGFPAATISGLLAGTPTDNPDPESDYRPGREFGRFTRSAINCPDFVFTESEAS